MGTVFIRLFNISVTATWIALAVIILRPLLKKAPKSIRVFMWALVAFRLICPFSFESALSLVPSAETVPPDIIYSDAPTIHSGIVIFNSTINPIISESLAPKPETSVNPMQVITQAATVVWAVGALLMLLYALFSYLRVYRKVKEAGRLERNIWLCDRIDAPFILGVFRPRIYLPSSMSETDMGYVIAHEQAHLKRLDHIWKPLGFLLLTVYWFNPVFWVAYVMLCKDIELACDERVIKALGNDSKKPYSEALINCSASRKAISACPLAFGEVGVKERVKAVLSYKKATFWIILATIIACIILAVVFLTNPPEKDNTEDNSSVSGVGGVDQPENVVVTPSIEELKEKYPEYFKFSPKTRVAVFAWQTAPEKYSFGIAHIGYVFRSGLPSYYYLSFGDMAFSHQNNEELEEAINNISAILPPLTLEEAHAILAYCMVPTEHISVIPIKNPTGAYNYEVTDNYCEKTKGLFWNGLKAHISALNIDFVLPYVTVTVGSAMYGENGIKLGLIWQFVEGFTEATKTEYPKYHIKITVGDNSKFTFLPLPEEWYGDNRSVTSSYFIDLPAKEGDDIVFDLYLNDDKTFISNIFKITDVEAPELPETDIGIPISYSTFDIDGDGETERLELFPGYTSGLYTFRISILDLNGGIHKDYRNTFLTDFYTPKRFCTLSDGYLYLECEKIGEKNNFRYYKIELNDDKTIVLRYGEETMRYWGD